MNWASTKNERRGSEKGHGIPAAVRNIRCHALIVAQGAAFHGGNDWPKGRCREGNAPGDAEGRELGESVRFREGRGYPSLRY